MITATARSAIGGRDRRLVLHYARGRPDGGCQPRERHRHQHERDEHRPAREPTDRAEHERDAGDDRDADRHLHESGRRAAPGHQPAPARARPRDTTAHEHDRRPPHSRARSAPRRGRRARFVRGRRRVPGPDKGLRVPMRPSVDRRHGGPATVEGGCHDARRASPGPLVPPDVVGALRVCSCSGARVDGRDAAHGHPRRRCPHGARGRRGARAAPSPEREPSSSRHGSSTSRRRTSRVARPRASAVRGSPTSAPPSS